MVATALPIEIVGAMVAAVMTVASASSKFQQTAERRSGLPCCYSSWKMWG